MRLDSPPRVLITGAGTGIGRACAEAMASRGAELILCDNDAQTLREATDELGAVGRFCDVASEASVAVFAADIIETFRSLDLLINAAGGGYERTLGMYRVSRALLPALRRGSHFKLMLNVPPEEDAGVAIFPYASSGQAFQRLSAALAAETKGTGVDVLIGNPETCRISQVVPDPNAGPNAAIYGMAKRTPGGGSLVSQIADLLGPGQWERQQAG
ncbi:MAG TPA: SDR family NAD(P)-dependent oxidoreductase [Sphingomicrobium sp.]|jgi:NAD(P)-dependent dehydrogenase (short-subunit alcohol dehydrogenase family)|nr:SDR family NAD(P)-dependent oxidoreductase [Sphingomicrobium sp.]